MTRTIFSLLLAACVHGMEGAGEDTYLASRIAAARLKGFQGRQLGDTDVVMACVKNFAAHGAAVGGRDYNSVDMSERMLWETYLPPRGDDRPRAGDPVQACS